MRYAINGLLSLTCDGNPILGESLVKGLWTAAAVWIKEGPGVGRAVAEWMTHGHSEIDVHHSDIARFHPHQMRREHTRLRTTEAFIKTYGIIHPAEQYESDRDQRLVADARVAAEARRDVLRDRGLGAAALVRVQRRPARGVRRRRTAARARVGRALVEPDHQRRAPADARGGRRHRPVGVPGLRHHRPRRARHRAAHLRRAVRRRRRQGDLHAGARRQGRLRLRPDRDAARRRPLPRRHRRRPRPGRPAVVRQPAARRRRDDDHRPHRRGLDDRPVGSAGPRHPGRADRRRRVRRGLRLPDLPRDHRGRRRRCSPRASPTSASSAGSCTSRWTTRPRSGRRCSRRAPTHGAVPVGIGVYGTTGRIEKGYRAFGYELDAERIDRRGRDAAAEGEGRRLRRPRGVRRPARRRRAVRAVHAGRRRPHLGERA